MVSVLRNYIIHYRSLIALGIPIIIGQLGNIVTGFADTIMVGQHSTEELAASSFVNNVMMAFIVVGTGFAYNLIPLIGENLAKKRYEEIGRWFKNSIVANITTGLFIMAVLGAIYFNIDKLNQPDELMPLIMPYYRITFFSVIFVMMSNTFRQFVEGIGNPMVSMWILLTGNIINIIGNYVLIYGKFGAPELGLYGAGISTFVSRVLIVVMFVAAFAFRKRYACYRKGFVSAKISIAAWKKLNVMGWPVAIQQGLEAWTFCMTAIMVGWLGSMQLAAHQIAITISTISFTIYLGLGSAVAIRASYFKGMNDWKMVRNITVSGVHLALLIFVIVCIILFAFRNSLGYIFTDEVQVNEIVIMLIPILMIYQLGDSVQIILTNALRGLAEVRTIMWISFASYFIIAIPFGYFCGFVIDMGISGLWMAYPVGFACAVVMLYIRMKKLIRANI